MTPEAAHKEAVAMFGEPDMNATVFGVPVSDLSRETLITIMLGLFKEQQASEVRRGQAMLEDLRRSAWDNGANLRGKLETNR